MEAKLIEALGTIAGIGLAYLLVLAGAWLRVHLGAGRFALLASLAATAVRFVEQHYPQLKGEGKYKVAAEWFAAQAKRLRIPVTEDQVRGIIESAVAAMNGELGRGRQAEAAGA